MLFAQAIGECIQSHLIAREQDEVMAAPREPFGIEVAPMPVEAPVMRTEGCVLMNLLSLLSTSGRLQMQSVSEKGQRLRDEVRVVLEDAAVPGVLVGDQLRVRDAARQVAAVFRGHHTCSTRCTMSAR